MLHIPSAVDRPGDFEQVWPVLARCCSSQQRSSLVSQGACGWPVSSFPASRKSSRSTTSKSASRLHEAVRVRE
jgi:hypothetical protein